MGQTLGYVGLLYGVRLAGGWVYLDAELQKNLDIRGRLHYGYEMVKESNSDGRWALAIRSRKFW
jgi:hypothetical protein